MQSTVVQDLPPLQVENVRHLGGIGYCMRCKTRVTSNLPGASSVGDAATQVQLGPGLSALALSLRFDEHVSLYGISRLLKRWFGLQVTPSGLSQLFARLRSRTAPAMTEIVTELRQSSVVGIDETSLRQNGVGAWVWILRNPRASLFRVELSRGAWVADQLLGETFGGTLCSDFYGVYTRRDDWLHAYCNAHTIREAKKIAEVSGDPRAARFSDRLRDIFDEGQLAQLSDDPLAKDHVKRRMRYLVGSHAFADLPEVVRLQSRIEAHFDGVMRFVDRPDVPMTNNATERDLRPLALHRKVTGGTRSREGSQALGHWMSVTQTLRKNDLDLRDWIAGAFDAHLYRRPPPSVFAQSN
jgi:hypothetical protein